MDKADTRQFVSETRQWLQKKMTLMTIGLNGLEIQPRVLYRVDFIADLQEYKVWDCGTFSCKSELKSSTDAPPVYIPSSTSTDQILPLAAKEFNEMVDAAYEKTAAELAKDAGGGIATGYYVSDGAIGHVEAVGSEFRISRGRSIRYKISSESAQLLKAQGSQALCSEQKTVAALLESTSVSENILFDSVSEDTIERHFSQENMRPMKLNHPIRE